MQPEWIIGMLTVLIAILGAFLKVGKETHPELPAERYSELNSLLTDKEAIRNQLRMGNKINAIKLYRQQTGVRLKEAKEAVEMMEQEMLQATISDFAENYKEFDEIKRMLLAGKKIKAIKLYRQQTGVGLKEAKNVIDGMMIEMKATRPTGSAQVEQGQVDPDELHRLIRAGQKIHAIKYYRETTGVGLKEAKEAVDWLEAQMYQNK